MKKLLLLSLLLLSPCAHPSDLQSLVDADRLRLDLWLEPSEGIVTGQEVHLIIEVATQRWFAGGTRIHIPEVPQLIILQRDPFANNINLRENGVSWVKQRWTLQLYPQSARRYAIPAIQLDLAVNDAELGAVRGSLMTAGIELLADTPRQLGKTDNWVSSPSFSVTQSVDRELKNLQPGAAFRREINFSANMLTAMMLPTADTRSPAGLAAYPESPILKDKSNRGEAVATRTEVVVYVVEQAGQYYLPEQTYYWWNTQDQEARTVVLPALSIDAGVAAAGVTQAPPVSEPDTPMPTRWLAAFSVMALMLLLLLLLFFVHKNTTNPKKNYLRQARRAQRRGNTALASALLYQWLNSLSKAGVKLSLRQASNQEYGSRQAAIVDALLAESYGDKTQPTELLRTQTGFQRHLPRWLRLRRHQQQTFSLNPENSAGERTVFEPPLPG